MHRPKRPAWCRERFDEGLLEVRSVAMRLNVSDVVAARATGNVRLPQVKDCGKCPVRKSCEWPGVAAMLAVPVEHVAGVDTPGAHGGLAN